MSDESIPPTFSTGVSREMSFARGYSLLFAFVYIFLVGRWNEPHGLQLTLLTALPVAALWHLRRLLSPVPARKENVLAVIGLLNSMWFVFTTNEYLLRLNVLLFLVITSLQIVSRMESQPFPMSAGEWVGGSLRAVGRSMLNIFDAGIFAAFFKVRTIERAAGNRKLPIKAVALTFFVLLVFHTLFASVNAEYAAFMEKLIAVVMDFLMYVFEIDFVLDCFFVLLLGYLSFVVLGGVGKARAPGEPKTLRDSVELIVGGSVVLFLVFFSFQTKLLFMAPSTLSFKDLSLYVQRGFWELLAVALFGYAVLLTSLWQRPIEVETGKRWRNLLLVFTAELLLIAVFCAHKLGVLQLYFGMKDQRVLASAAVLLIAASFVMMFRRIFGSMPRARMFELQVYMLAVTILGLNALNVDLFVTRVSPTHYYIDGREVKDYSYLLTNSFDNSSEWLALMDQAEQTGIPVPNDYYWGRYSSLCGYAGQGSGSRAFSLRRQGVLSRYDAMTAQPTLRRLSQFNFREYTVYLLIQRNTARFRQFDDFVSAVCSKPVDPRPDPKWPHLQQRMAPSGL